MIDYAFSSRQVTAFRVTQVWVYDNQWLLPAKCPDQGASEDDYDEDDDGGDGDEDDDDGDRSEIKGRSGRGIVGALLVYKSPIWVIFAS